MENEEAEGVGDEGNTKDEGLSLLLLPTPRGSDGDVRSRSLDLTGNRRWVLERSRVWVRLGCEEGLDGLRTSVLGLQLLSGLLVLFMYISISSASSRRAVGVVTLPWPRSCAVAIRDKGSNPASMSERLDVLPLQVMLLLFEFCSGSVASSSPLSLSAAKWCCLLEKK